MRLTHYLSVINREHGGVVRAVLDLCHHMAGRGHDLTLMTCDPTDVPGHWRNGQAGAPRLVTLKSGWGTGRWIGRTSLERVASQLDQTDVLHLHGPWDRANLQLARLALQGRRPYVITPHGMLDDWSMGQKRFKKRIYHWLWGHRLLAGAAFVHCTAEGERDQAARWFGPGRAAVLPYMVDLDPYRQLPGPDLARCRFAAAAVCEPRILLLSRLHVKKGVELLIKAAAMLRDRRIGFKLLLAGPGEPAFVARCHSLVRQLDLTEQVAFLGMVDGQEKLSLYQAADLFVLPTHQENFGIVLLEAMACRTPVITTRGTDIWAELEAGGAVIVERTPETIAAAMAQLLQDPAQRRQLGDRGRRHIFNLLEPRRLGARYDQMYAAACRSNSGRTVAAP